LALMVPVGGATQASGVNNLRWLVNDVEFDLRNTLLHNSEPFGGRIRDVDDSSGNERTTVINPNCHGPPIGDVRNTHSRAEWHRTVSGGQFVPIKLFPTRGL
jgi:hypothetical protein